MANQDPFEVKFTSPEVSAWAGLALLKRMLDGLGFKAAMQSWDLPQPGSNRGYRPEQLIEQMIVSICYRGRASHHPLLAFCADWRLVANFWLRPGNTSSSNNVLAFVKATLANLGTTTVSLFRADSGVYDKTIAAFLKGRKINHIISARLTQVWQQAIVDRCQWQDLAPGLQVCDLRYQPHAWQEPQRLVVLRQHMQRKAGGVAGKTVSLFADDPDLQGWRYGAMLTDMSLSAIQVWNLYRGRADCENRIKELKTDFGLDSFVLRDFWATEAALGVSMLAYNLMSVFRHAVMRQRVHHTLATLHHKVLAVGAFWEKPKIKPDMPTLRLAVARHRRHWFEGLWANAGEPFSLKPA